MTTIRSIIDYIEELAGHPLHPDEGLRHGLPDRETRRVLICWMAMRDVLSYAGEAGFDLVLAHESAYYPYEAVIHPEPAAERPHWPTNRGRRELLDRYDLALLRVHGSLDEICIFDDFAALLGLGEPVEADGLAKVYEIPPCSLGALVAQVKERMGLPALRVSAPQGLGQIVHRVGLPWGGLGLFANVGYQQKLIERGCDVFIAGESDNYGFRFASECDIPMIETGHEISENPGLQHFRCLLQDHFPQLDVEFWTCQPVAEIL